MDRLRRSRLHHRASAFFPPSAEARGKETISGVDPFVMQADGKGWIFVPTGLQDGPLPTHYEPEESLIKNPLYGQQCNPLRMEWWRKDNAYHRAYDDPRFPYLITTYRLTEHHTAGGMSRWLTWLSELQPQMFCEVSPELAAERGLQNGGWATIRTARAEIEARVLVTNRIPPLRIRGRLVHQIGLPYHWSSRGVVRGDAANDLIVFVADPNVSIQESKAFTADIVAGRRSAEGERRPAGLWFRKSIRWRGNATCPLRGTGRKRRTATRRKRPRRATSKWRLPKASLPIPHLHRLQGL